MAAQRHPLVGDHLYGADPTVAASLGLTRQWLHAVRLRFDHPTTGDELEVTSDYAPDLVKSLELLANR
jgi:23S rRNA pseudouridine1911/1915/1917 synthase